MLFKNVGHYKYSDTDAKACEKIHTHICILYICEHVRLYVCEYTHIDLSEYGFVMAVELCVGICVVVVM